MSYTHTHTARAIPLTVLSASRVSPLDKEIALIALPTLATLAADPIASLVDTAYIGHLGKPCHQTYTCSFYVGVSGVSLHERTIYPFSSYSEL
jgi:hypothetical protein